MRLTIAFFAFTAIAVAADAPLLLQKPTLSKTHIVFAYAGDLWSVPRDGGDAVRLTSGAGIETDPAFSPDGTRIAFTGEYDGNVDVVRRSRVGRRAETAHLAPGAPITSWAGRPTASASSSVRREPRTRVSREMFTVPAEGGVEEKLPLPTGYEASMSADGESIAYEPTGKAFTMWKRYRGGQTARIWLARLSDSTVTKVPRTNSNDFNPMWAGDRVYLPLGPQRAGHALLLRRENQGRARGDPEPGPRSEVRLAWTGRDCLRAVRRDFSLRPEVRQDEARVHSGAGRSAGTAHEVGRRRAAAGLAGRFAERRARRLYRPRRGHHRARGEGRSSQPDQYAGSHGARAAVVAGRQEHRVPLR